MSPRTTPPPSGSGSGAGPDPDRASGDDRRRGPLPEGYSRYAGLGVQFAATMGVLGALGYWADTRFGTDPWLMIVGIFLGAVGGFVSLIKEVPAPSSRRPPHRTSDPTDTP